MRILGIDPGYAIMGYGIVEYKGSRFTPVAYGSITTEAHTPNEERLMILYDELSRIIKEYQPEEASIEELFYNTNATTAIMVGEARGTALLACAKAGIRISEYTPLQIKSALTGYGRADKKQVQAMVKMKPQEARKTPRIIRSTRAAVPPRVLRETVWAEDCCGMNLSLVLVSRWYEEHAPSPAAWRRVVFALSFYRVLLFMTGSLCGLSSTLVCVLPLAGGCAAWCGPVPAYLL